MDLPELKNPPIVEVGCGFVFEPALAPQLADVVNAFWDVVRSDFPYQSADEEKARFWLLSKDWQFVIAIVRDRFTFSWRKTEAAYPRFSGSSGVSEKAVHSFQVFEEICSKHSVLLDTVGLELTKVDLFPYEQIETLFAEIPILKSLAGLVQRVSKAVFDVDDVVDEIGIRTSLRSDYIERDGTTAAWLQLNARTYSELKPFAGAFVRLNTAANNAFSKVLSAEALERRAKGEQ